jgi:hypothetical protein
MEPQELAMLEVQIRSILAAADLQWIAENVDDAISAGVSSEKGITIRKGRGLTLFGEEPDIVAEIVEPGSRQRPQRIVATNEPVTQEGRIGFFITALRRAVAELPGIQEESVKTLAGTSDELAGRSDQLAGSASLIQFRPDEDAATQEPPRLVDLNDDNARQLRLEALRVLEELAAEVRQ